MLKMKATVRGLDSIGRANARIKRTASDTATAADAMHEYLKTRIWKQYQNSGVVPGPYGEGSRKWSRNATSTIRKKGFDKPMFSSRGPYGTSLMKNYDFRARRVNRGNNRVDAFFTLMNKKPYAEYLHQGNEGRNLPARWCLGFIPGDGKWLLKYAADRALRVDVR